MCFLSGYKFIIGGNTCFISVYKWLKVCYKCVISVFVAIFGIKLIFGLTGLRTKRWVPALERILDDM